MAPFQPPTALPLGFLPNPFIFNPNPKHQKNKLNVSSPRLELTTLQFPKSISSHHANLYFMQTIINSAVILFHHIIITY